MFSVTCRFIDCYVTTYVGVQCIYNTDVPTHVKLNSFIELGPDGLNGKSFNVNFKPHNKSSA
jgi:hypothetical protein